jgi:hypothetical protein
MNLLVHTLIVKEDDQVSGETHPIAKRDVDGLAIVCACTIILRITRPVCESDSAANPIASRHEIDEVLIWALIPKEVSPQFTPISGPNTRPDHPIAPTALLIEVATHQRRSKLPARGERDIDAVTVVCALPIVRRPPCTMLDFNATTCRGASRAELCNVLGRVSIIEKLCPSVTPVIYDYGREARWGRCWCRHMVICPYNSVTPMDFFVHTLIVHEEDQLSGESKPVAKRDIDGVAIIGACAIIV